MTIDSIEGAWLLQKLATGQTLDKREIRSFMLAAIRGDIGPEQLGAFLMGVACHGLSREARFALTQSYYVEDTGDKNGDSGFFDKHSTGGVGDKLTFVVLPLAAAAGVRVRKLSGGSLAHCRGTIDKLSSLPGFRHVDQLDEMTREADRFGFSIGKTSPDFCAGDNLTYRARNLCGAAKVPDLIAASIMSKKLALQPRGLVLDVKLGCGGLFADRETARETAFGMIEIAEDFGLPARAYLTEMEVPLGRTVGGLAEVREAMDILSGQASQSDVASLALVFASALVQMDRSISSVEAEQVIEQGWRSGQAHELFVSWLRHRGVDVATLNALKDHIAVYAAPQSGWISNIDARKIGSLSAELARTPGMGDVVFLRSVGDAIEKGAPIAQITVPKTDTVAAMAKFGDACQFASTAPIRRPIIAEVLETTRNEQK
jgi:pyrimidine-nucleoside phosphorylase